MKLLSFSNNNLDEVVFEHRNKAYGAYAIRKMYPENLNKSMFLTIAPLLLALVSSIIYNILKPTSFVPKSVVYDTKIREKIKDIVEVSGGFTFILENPLAGFDIVIDKKVKPEVKKPKLPEPIEMRPIVSGSSKGLSEPNLGMLGMGGLGGAGLGLKGGEGEQGGNTLIEFIAEKMPQFPGGQEAMYAYISQNLQYPRQAVENNVSGKVMISFVIMPDGKVEMSEIEKGIGFGCDD
ncbi:MAG: energy transducer TonB, partial [Bacteroidia bacterium]|nr:energy transducer TonB [Bacteroidia bacterium]